MREKIPNFGCRGRCPRSRARRIRRSRRFGSPNRTFREGPSARRMGAMGWVGMGWNMDDWIKTKLGGQRP